MSPNHKTGFILALLGFAILLLGSWGYMGVYSLSVTVSYILMGVGLAMVIASMVVMYLMKDADEHVVKEE
ncbi:MAG: hypothetical protein WC067_02205 [Candidatus Methanomethylophilaceae archaeon]